MEAAEYLLQGMQQVEAKERALEQARRARARQDLEWLEGQLTEAVQVRDEAQAEYDAFYVVGRRW